MKAPDWSAYERYIKEIKTLRVRLDAVMAADIYASSRAEAVNHIALLMELRIHAATVEINNITSALAAEFGA